MCTCVDVCVCVYVFVYVRVCVCDTPHRFMNTLGVSLLVAVIFELT